MSAHARVHLIVIVLESIAPCAVAAALSLSKSRTPRLRPAVRFLDIHSLNHYHSHNHNHILSVELYSNCSLLHAFLWDYME